MYTQVRPSAGSGGLTMGLTASAAADARLNQRISFDVPFSVIFIAALHGVSALKIFAIIYINYSIAKKLPRQYVPAVTWIFNVAILFANELCQGYSFAAILDFFLPSTHVSEKDQATASFGHSLDNYGGLMPRWEVLFKFTILRQISFNLDYYWSLNSRVGSPIEVRHILHSLPVKLMTSRRSNLIPRTSPKGIVFPSLLNQATFAFATTLHILCIRPCISRVQL